MASNRVATLEIQMAADITRLQKDMKDAQRAIDAMTGGAEAGFNKSGRAASNMARAAQDAAAGMNKASGQGRMMAQQFSQMAQQVMAGGNAIQALAIQLPDIVSQLNATGKATSGFIGILAGPWGIAITSAVSLLAMMGMEMLKTEDATKKADRATKSLTERLDILSNSYEVMIAATREYNKEQTQARALTLETATAIERQTRANLAGAKAYLASLQNSLIASQFSTVGATGGRAGNYGAVYAEEQRVQGVQREISAMIKQALADVTALEASVQNAQANVAEEMAKIATDPAYAIENRFKRMRNEAKASIHDVNDLAKRLAEINRQEKAQQDALAASTRKRADESVKLAKVTGEEIARALGTTITSGLRSPARNRAAGGAANSYHLTGQAIDIPLTVNGRPITKEWIRQQLEPLGVQIKELLGPGDKGHSDHFHIAFGIKRLAPDQVRKFQEDAVEAAEKAAKAAREAWTREWQALYDMGTDLAKKVLPGLQQIEDASDAAFSRLLAEDNGKRTQWLTDAADANQRWNDRLEKTVQLVDQIGGASFGGAWSNLRAPLGQIAGMSVVRIDPNSGKELSVTLGRVFSDSLDKVFGGEGSFLKMLQGAATGGSIGALFGTPGSQLGGTIGGAFGEKFGEKFLQGGLNKIMKGLGDFAGPIGSILGGLAGGLLAKLFKGDKYGTATITGIDGFGTSGNSTKNQGPTNSLAQSFQQSLERIASSLDATLGKFAVSIGVTNGKINVNPGLVTGMIGTTKQRDTIDFGEDQAAALKYAIKNAIEDGALEGLSEGTKKYLVESNDIERALSKVAELKANYDELESLKDPQGYALTQLDKAFTELRATATATGDDLARIEELYGLKRKEIVEKYAEDTLDIERQATAMDAEIARLQGDAIKATTIARELEREQIDETLRARYDMIASLQDEAAATEAGNRILALQIRLSRAQGDEATAKALENMQELNSAQTEQERSMLRMIHETDRLMEQQEAASSAMSGFADMIASVADAAYKASAELRAYANQIFDEATQSDPTVLMSQIQAAMKAGNTAVLPELIRAYLPLAENQSGSLADYQRQVAYLRQGSLNTANLADAQATQSASAMSWYLRQMQETGGRGSWMSTMPDGFREEQERLGGITAEKLDRVIDLLERQNAIGADTVVELQTQTSTIDDAFNGGAGVVVLEPAP